MQVFHEKSLSNLYRWRLRMAFFPRTFRNKVYIHPKTYQKMKNLHPYWRSKDSSAILPTSFHMPEGENPGANSTADNVPPRRLFGLQGGGKRKQRNRRAPDSKTSRPPKPVAERKPMSTPQQSAKRNQVATPGAPPPYTPGSVEQQPQGNDGVSFGPVSPISHHSTPSWRRSFHGSPSPTPAGEPKPVPESPLSLTGIQMVPEPQSSDEDSLPSWADTPSLAPRSPGGNLSQLNHTRAEDVFVPEGTWMYLVFYTLLSCANTRATWLGCWFPCPFWKIERRDPAIIATRRSETGA